MRLDRHDFGPSQPEEPDNEFKRLLSAALADEPPLHLGREEVLRHGHRRLRTRRAAMAGGVAAGVVAVVLGAATLTGSVQLARGGDVVPAGPGISTTGSAGPTNPSATPAAPTTSTSAGEQPVRTTVRGEESNSLSSRVLPPSAEVVEAPLVPATAGQFIPRRGYAPSQAVADRLSAALAQAATGKSGPAIQDHKTGQRTLGGLASARFVPGAQGYLMKTTLSTDTGGGTLLVEVVAGEPDQPRLDCSAVRRLGPEQKCHEVEMSGQQVINVDQKGPGQLVVWQSLAQHEDGTRVLAMATNATSNGQHWSIPPADLGSLNDIATLPGLALGR